MSFFESYNMLVEKLRRPFYSEREAMKDRQTDSSQNTKERDLETPYLTYEPFSSYTSSYAFGSATDSISNYNELVRKWRDAALLPEVDDALSEITSEAIVFDELDDAVALNLDSIELSENIKTKIKESFSKILYLLDFNERGEETFRQWYIDGTLTYEVVYNNRKPKEGISKLLMLPPYNILKQKNEETSEVLWHINRQNHAGITNTTDVENNPNVFYDEQITQINSGVQSSDKKIYLSPINKAMKAINQLYLLEDTLIIYRLTKSPERRVFSIETGDLPKAKAEEYIKNMMQRFRQKKIYNTETGTINDGNKTISILEDFWFASKNGKGTTVTNLPGTQANFSSFEDVDYFLNKVYNALGVPNNRRNKDGRVTINANIDIEKDELKFYKYILKLRRRFNNLFVDLLKKDLIAKQVLSLDDWIKIQEKIKFKYADSNEISLIKKAQIMDIRVNGANNAIGLIEQKIVSPLFIQKNILRLSDEEITQINQDFIGLGTQGPDAMGNAPAGVMPQGGDTPGYTEVGAGGAIPPTGDTGTTPETTEPEQKGSRFQQKVKDSNLSQEVLDNLQDGDIITNGTTKLLYENGKFTKLT